MGAGKSTVAQALGARLGWQVEDVDELIEARERRSIADIFTQDGEAYFRHVERAVLQELLPQRHTIVATGGGTFAYAENRLDINRDGASIWLDVSFDRVIERLPPDGRRPLATDRTAMLAQYEARRTAYALAHRQLDGNRAPVGELVEHILDLLGF